MISPVGLERDVLIVTCAISAGIHAALVPAHAGEDAWLGLGFAVAALALAGLVAGLTLRPESELPVAGAGAVLAGLVASYALAATTGLPLLHPDPEPVDGLALVTKGVEAVGLLAAVHVKRRGRPAAVRPHPKGRLA